MFSSFRKQIKNWITILTRLIRVCWMDIFRLIMWPCSNASPGAVWAWNTAFWAIFWLVLGLVAEKSPLESLHFSLGLDSWLLLLPLLSKDKHSQTFPKHDGALMYSLKFHQKNNHNKGNINKAREATLCIQRESDQGRKGSVPLTDRYLFTSNPATEQSLLLLIYRQPDPKKLSLAVSLCCCPWSLTTLNCDCSSYIWYNPHSAQLSVTAVCRKYDAERNKAETVNSSTAALSFSLVSPCRFQKNWRWKRKSKKQPTPTLYLLSFALADRQLCNRIGQNVVIVAVAEGADFLHQKALGAVHGHDVVV